MATLKQLKPVQNSQGQAGSQSSDAETAAQGLHDGSAGSGAATGTPQEESMDQVKGYPSQADQKARMREQPSEMPAGIEDRMIEGLSGRDAAGKLSQDYQALPVPDSSHARSMIAVDDIAEKRLLEEIISRTQKHIPLFQEKWTEFCEWVEGCAEELKSWQDNYPKRYRNLQDRVRRIDAVRRRGEHPKPRSYPWRSATEAERKEREKRRKQRLDQLDQADSKAWKQLRLLASRVRHEHEVREDDWIEQTAYASFLSIPEWVAFYTPQSVVNPLVWLFNQKQHRSPGEAEQQRLDFGLIAVVHDWVSGVSAMEADICCWVRPYPGKYFKRDDFCSALFDDLKGTPFTLPRPEMMVMVQRAWNRVKDRLPQPAGQESPQPLTEEWSQPLTKTRIATALGIESSYRLGQYVKDGVYRLRPVPMNRQAWQICLTQLNSTQKAKLQKA